MEHGILLACKRPLISSRSSREVPASGSQWITLVMCHRGWESDAQFWMRFPFSGASLPVKKGSCSGPPEVEVGVGNWLVCRWGQLV